MFNTSGDILNLVIAISVGVLTIFISLTLYQLLTSLSRIKKIVKSIEAGVEKFEDLILLIKNKLRHSSTYLMLLAETAKRAVDYLKEKKDKPKKAASPKKKK
ncbi:MAG: hypothetical protein ACOX0C_00695 [Patescibacteria group bacterium]|jgi:uncharacterized membrane protein YjfL (UPF0719 family)